MLLPDLSGHVRGVGVEVDVGLIFAVLVLLLLAQSRFVEGSSEGLQQSQGRKRRGRKKGTENLTNTTIEIDPSFIISTYKPPLPLPIITPFLFSFA